MFIYCLRNKACTGQKNPDRALYYSILIIYPISIIADADLAQNMETNENDENSDNSNLMAGDEETALKRKIEKKKNRLNEEEDKLNQIR